MSASVQLGLRIPPAAPATTIAQAITRAEQLGWDTVWIPDSQLLWRDPFVVLAVAATHTSRIRLGIAVTNFRTRHLTVLASALRSCAELAPGRVLAAVGAGNSSVRPIGLRPTPTRQLARDFTRLRHLLSGREVDFGARPMLHLRDAPEEVPLYLAATGPRNLELAGQIADGALIQVGTTVEAVGRAIMTVSSGAMAADREPGNIPIVVTAPYLLTDDLGRDAALLKPHAVTMARDGASEALVKAGVTVMAPPSAGATTVYPDLLHAEDQTAAVRACRRYVSDEDAVRFAERFAFAGGPNEVRERITGIHAAGVTEVMLQHLGSYGLPHDLITQANALRPNV